MNRYSLVVLGMALQALIVSLLTKLEAINPTPGQQLGAGIFFILIAVVIKAK